MDNEYIVSDKFAETRAKTVFMYRGRMPLACERYTDVLASELQWE